MDCAALRDLLHPFLDGELEVAQNVSILKHAELCAACRGRLELEKQLSGIVEASAREPLSEADRERLLEGAFARVAARASGRHPAPPSRVWRFLRAAVVLLAVGAAWTAYADPFCFGGCPTEDVMTHAYECACEHPPLPLDELARRHPDLQLSALERLKKCQVEVLGGNVIKTPGMPDRAIFRLRCKKSGKRATFVWIPGGHGHFWQRSTRRDGRVYLQTHHAQVQFVGWEDARGVWGCVGDVGNDALYSMAASVRDSGS